MSLHLYRFRMPVENRYSDTGRTHRNRLITEYFLRLPHHFHFFFGVTVVEENVYLRQHVECDLLRINLGLSFAPVEQFSCLLSKLFDGGLASARHSLVSRHANSLNTDGVVNWL